MGCDEKAIRRSIVEIGRWMWERGLIAGREGNLSARLPEDRILTTPAGRAKGRLDESDLVVVDFTGRAVAGCGQPSSEIGIHLAAYRVRPDVEAVVHAHPSAVVAHSMAGVALLPAFNPEVYAAVGPIAEIGYERAGSEALAALFEPVLCEHNTFIMAHHGAVTLGSNLEQAYDRLEMLEQTARMQVMARRLKPKS